MKKTEFQLAYVLLALAVAMGLAVRINFISGTDFPLNDGGFFYQMVQDLVANDFKLPEYTSYNNANIPYSYPPLAFYISGAASHFFSIPLLSLFRFLPAIISTITIPVFFILSKRYIDNLFFRSMATYIFATLPRSFEWFVMGGGITRSLGFLFAVITLICVWKMLDDQARGGWVLIASICASLTVLSHPVATLFLVFSVAAIVVYNIPTKSSILRCLVMGVLVLVLTAPWWANVVKFHGISPFVSAGNTGHLDWFEIKNLITLDFGFENPYFLPVISVFAVLGMFERNKRRALFLGSTLIFGYIFIPRGGVDLLTVYLALLGTIGLQETIRNWKLDGGDPTSTDGEVVIKAKAFVLVLFLFVYLLLGSFTYKFVNNKGSLYLTGTDLEAMHWVRDNTDKSAKILLLPSAESNQYWWNDYRAEWLPVISERESLITVQGYEWLPQSFAERVSDYTDLRSCVDTGPICVRNWESANQVKVDYIMIADAPAKTSLVEAYFDQAGLISEFQNEEWVIFSKE